MYMDACGVAFVGLLAFIKHTKNRTMNKRIFDIIFMIISTIILVILLEYGFLEKYIGFALIPILIAYQLGQYSERKFKK